MTRPRKAPGPSTTPSESAGALMGSARDVPRQAPATELELEVAFLVREGFATPVPGGEYVLTQDGRDWLLWSTWQALGRPGMPDATATEEVSP